MKVCCEPTKVIHSVSQKALCLLLRLDLKDKRTASCAHTRILNPALLTSMFTTSQGCTSLLCFSGSE